MAVGSFRETEPKVGKKRVQRQNKKDDKVTNI